MSARDSFSAACSTNRLPLSQAAMSAFINPIGAPLLGGIRRGISSRQESCAVVVELTAAVIILSWICGLVAALGKTSSHSVLRWPCEFYIWFIRGTPTLIQIFIVYFGIPQLGIRLSPFTAGVVALGVKRRLCRRDHPRRSRRYSQGQTESADSDRHERPPVPPVYRAASGRPYHFTAHH